MEDVARKGGKEKGRWRKPEREINKIQYLMLPIRQRNYDKANILYTGASGPAGNPNLAEVGMEGSPASIRK